MGLRRPELRLGSAVRRLGGRQGVGIAIVSITDGGAGDSLVTTAGPHGLTAATPRITLSGAGVFYNGVFTLDGSEGGSWATDTPTTIKLLANYSGDATGGLITPG